MNLFRLKNSNYTNRKFSERPLLLVALVFICFAISPMAQAVNPPPDGGYLGGNTAEGTEALNSVILLPGRGGEVGALRNTAIGYQTLFSDITGSDNTATGYQALKNNTASFNSAFGGLALFGNTGGSHNSGVGWGALRENTTGNDNTAVGYNALTTNNAGGNTAVGSEALKSNTEGTDNTAVGYQAAFNNVGFAGPPMGRHNTATGSQALYTNHQGSFNTAIGYKALFSDLGSLGMLFVLGSNNTAVGANALENNTTGSFNVALGTAAGQLQTTGSGNVYIGSNVQGVAGENGACYIASIVLQTSANGLPVFVNSANKLGTGTSSKRFKEDIKPMDKASAALLALKPVTFRYKKAIDPDGKSQFGLVAEDVEKVNPDLVVRDKDGKPYSVRYDQVNAMLLNEFLKEHYKVERLEKQVEALTAGLQEVSAQLELSKPEPWTVLNASREKEKN